MRLNFILLQIFFLASLMVYSQPRLAWRMNNPRITYVAPDNWLEFDIQVRSDTSGAYFTNMTIVINYGKGLSQLPADFVVTKGPNYNSTNTIGNPRYDIVTNTTGKYSVEMTMDPTIAFLPALPVNLTEIDTLWDTWAIVRIKILQNDSTAGLTFRNLDAGGFSAGAYRDLLGTTDLPFLNPHLIETKDLKDLYLGRIFSNAFGITQAGGIVDWSQPLNTSIWDSIAFADTASVANKLRIHSSSQTGGFYTVAEQKGGFLAIPPGTSLTVNDSTIIENSNGLVIMSDATGSGQFLDNGITYVNNGTVEADAWFSQDKWHYYSPAVQISNYSAFFYRYMKYYNELDASNANGVTAPYHSFKYIVAIDTTVLPPMTGYAMWSSSSGIYTTDPSVKPKGILNTGPLTYSITRSPWAGQSPPYDGWNLIGNPYPSAINLSNPNVGWTQVEPSAWFWNPVAGNYEVYLLSGEGTRFSPIAAPQQGFFVHHTTSTTTPGQFSLDNSVRTINNEPFLKETVADVLRLKVSGSMNSLSDKIVIRFLTNATTGYDEGYDAYKLTGDAAAPQLYSLSNNGNKLTVNAQPWNTTVNDIPLYFTAGIEGQYVLSASNTESFNEKLINLEDKKLNVIQELNTNPDYTFIYSYDDDPQRFILHFVDSPLAINDKSSDQMKIYSSGNKLYVMNQSLRSGKIEVFDMTGRILFNGDLNDVLVNQYNVSVTDGTYAVKVTTSNGTYSKRVFLGDIK